MNTKKVITLFFVMLMLSLTVATNVAKAQTHSHASTSKDYCMMKDGKMMYSMDGKVMPVDKEMTMKNGTKCLPSGECVTKDGKKIKMKDGECMDMNGNIEKCGMKDSKASSDDKSSHQHGSTYSCSMHPDLKYDKPGKCPKCGMELVEKKK